MKDFSIARDRNGLLALLNPDGSVVVAFGNAGERHEATVEVGGHRWTVTLPAQSVSTLVVSKGR